MFKKREGRKKVGASQRGTGEEAERKSNVEKADLWFEMGKSPGEVYTQPCAGF